MRTIFLALLSLAGLVGLEAQLAPPPDPTPQALSWTDGLGYTYDGAGNIKRIGTDVQVGEAAATNAGLAAAAAVYGFGLGVSELFLILVLAGGEHAILHRR